MPVPEKKGDYMGEVSIEVIALFGQPDREDIDLWKEKFLNYVTMNRAMLVREWSEPLDFAEIMFYMQAEVNWLPIFYAAEELYTENKLNDAFANDRDIILLSTIDDSQYRLTQPVPLARYSDVDGYLVQFLCIDITEYGKTEQEAIQQLIGEAIGNLETYRRDAEVNFLTSREQRELAILESLFEKIPT